MKNKIHIRLFKCRNILVFDKQNRASYEEEIYFQKKARPENHGRHPF